MIHLDALAATAVGVQRAADQHEVFEAVGSAIGLLGLSGHIAELDPTGSALVIRKVAMPWSHQAQLERIHEGPLVGARFELDAGTAHKTVLQQRRSMHAPAPIAWVISVAPRIGPAEIGAIRDFIGIGEALLVPITDERSVFGVLTVWSARLTHSDRAVVEILGRLAGGALSVLRARDAAWRGDGATEPPPASAGNAALAA